MEEARVPRASRSPDVGQPYDCLLQQFWTPHDKGPHRPLSTTHSAGLSPTRPASGLPIGGTAVTADPRQPSISIGTTCLAIRGCGQYYARRPRPATPEGKTGQRGRRSYLFFSANTSSSLAPNGRGGRSREEAGGLVALTESIVRWRGRRTVRSDGSSLQGKDQH